MSSSSRAGDEVVITVRDTGQGIAMEDRERIFESFQQGPREAPKEEGTGLGLTLCRRIVTLIGGRIWLESELGRGSAFHVAVPLGVPADTVDGDCYRVCGESPVRRGDHRR